MIEIYFDGVLIDSDYYAKITNDFKLFDEKFMLGTTTSNTFVIEVPSNIVTSIPLNVNIKLDGKDYANLIVDKFEIINDTMLSLTLTDKMTLFNVPYDASSIVPCSLATILQHICTSFGVELGTQDFINSDIIVNYYDSTVNARDYIGYIAELNGGYAVIGQDGKLYLKKFDSLPVDVDIDTCEDFRIHEHHIVERVVFDNGLLKYETSQDTTLETIYLDPNNVYITSQEIFDNIANEILGFEFYSFETGNCEINPSLLAGDLINFTDGINNYISIAQYSLDFNGRWIGGYSLNVNSKQQQETQQIGLDTQIKNIKVRLDRDENELDIVVQNAMNNSSDIANLNIKADSIQSSVSNIENEVDENYNEITQTIDNLMVSIQNTGGSNLIANSVMFALDSYGSPTSWNVEGDGTLNIQSSSEAISNGGISGHVFILNNKKVRQRVNVKADNNDIPDDQKSYYTLNCKIKKSAVGTAYIKVFNDNEEYLISLEPGQDIFYSDYEISGILPTMNYYDVEFYGSEDSDVTFTDVMFALGKYKTSWTQANGEIMNTQVNINVDGVLVKSSVYEGDYTVMSPLEFAGYSNINGIVTKVFSLNKDVTTMTKVEAKNEIKMIPLKAVAITTGDLQGWAFVPSTKEQGG